MADKDVW